MDSYNDSAGGGGSAASDQQPYQNTNSIQPSQRKAKQHRFGNKHSQQ